MMRKNNILNKVCFCAIYGALLGGCGYGKQDDIIVIGSAEEDELREGSVQGESTDPADFSEPAAREEKASIRVYVCGAVRNPGVVSVPAGSRAEDALMAAGGFGEDAGREAVNLADWVTDGQMLYFPTREEAAELPGESDPAQGLVNINRADAAELCTLPGIGESRAADIIAYREKQGGFDSCEDIMKVPGIKMSVYEKICDKITVK